MDAYMPKNKKKKWFLVWLLQLAAMALVSLIATFAPLILITPIAQVVNNICKWALMPELGVLSVYRATRAGLNHYIAWIAPPLMYSAIPWLILDFPPDALVMLILAFASIVAAAAGDVKNRYENND